jgi:hypothetical protein
VCAASFVLCGCPSVAQTAIPASGAARIAGIAIRHWDFMPLWSDLKLFPHFGEARTAIFPVKQVKYSGHDQTPSFENSYTRNRASFQADVATPPKMASSPRDRFRRNRSHEMIHRRAV